MRRSLGMVIMGRTRSGTGEAISAGRRTPAARAKLVAFIADAERRGDLDEWRRGCAILGYIEDRRVITMARELGKARGSINRWLGCYEARGVDGLMLRAGDCTLRACRGRRRFHAVAGPLVAYSKG